MNPTADTAAHLAPDGDGWQAHLALRYVARNERTLLAERKQHGPLLVQRPFYPEGSGVCHTYLLHPPGGIVGGDTLSLSLELEQHSHALITTPSATRWYYSDGRSARANQTAHVHPGAILEWLPQETLVFDGAHAAQTSRFDLEGDAQMCGWELLGLGRPASGEIFKSGALDFRFEIYRDGNPLLLERLRGGRPGVYGLGDHTATATFVATGADGDALDAAREVSANASDCIAAATLIGDLLVCRAVAADCAPLISVTREWWSKLRPPLIGLDAEAPRIWRT